MYGNGSAVSTLDTMYDNGSAPWIQCMAIFQHPGSGLGICSSNFGANCSFFAKKVSKWAIRSKKWEIRSFAHFWWATWAICSQSLIPSEQPERIAQKEWVKLLHFLKTSKKTVKTYKKYVFFEFFLANRSFLRAKEKNERFAQKNRGISSFAHLSWATWANCSHSLICHE